MLAGRDAEVDELCAAAMGAVSRGRGLLAFVCGEAGIGKTRLAGEVGERLRAKGIDGVWAACRPDRGAPPYWPWVQLLTALGRADALAVDDRGSPDLIRFRFFEDVAAALRGVAPVVLVLDDLHWADEPSLRLLEAVSAHVGTAAVVVLGTYRDTEPGATELARMAADRRVVLRGLSPAELGPALLEATGETIDPPAVGALYRRTGGNPFFAAEVVRLLRAENRLSAGVDSAVPAGVRAVLDRRIDRLPEATEAVMRAAAVLDAGTSTGVDTVLLAGVADVPPVELAERLAPSVDGRLLVVDGGRYRFAHALVADTVAARTPPAWRLELHRAAAAALGRRVDAGVADPAEVAHHQLAAARMSGNPDEARAAAERCAMAARTAVRRAAYEDAVRWLDESLVVLADLPEGRLRGELLCALGEAALAAGDQARSRGAFTDAAAHARRHRHPDLLAAAALGLTGGAAGFEVDLSDPDRIEPLEEALAALPTVDSRLRCAVSARLSVALAFTGVEPRRRDLADTAAAAARRLGDLRALAVALAARCDARAGPDHVADRRDMAEEIIACARTVQDRTLELLGRRLRLVALAEAGSWPEVDREIDTYTRVVEPLRMPGLTWYVPLWRGARAMMGGAEGVEEECDAELRRRAERSGSVNAELLALTQRFVRDVFGERSLSVDFARFLQLAPNLAAASYCTLALLRAIAGEAGAASLARRHLDDRADAPSDSEWLPEMVQDAMTAVLVGDQELADSVYAVLTPYAGLFAVEGILAGTWGCVDAHLGRLAHLLGRTAVARRHLAVAYELDAVAGVALAERTRRWAEEVDRSAQVTADGVPGDVAVHRDGVFHREGEVWTLAYGGRAVQLRDTKGLRDLAALIARPGRELAVHELIGAPDTNGGSFELADRTAIDAYRRRLADLEEERADASALHDPVRAERAAAERDALLDQLAAVTGLGGHRRRAGSDVERMRKAVGNRIRQALGRIEDVHPELGRHLRVSVRTGTFCRYEPDRLVRWKL